MSGFRHGHPAQQWSKKEWAVVVTVFLLLISLTLVNVRRGGPPEKAVAVKTSKAAAAPTGDPAQGAFETAGLRLRRPEAVGGANGTATAATAAAAEWVAQRKRIVLFGDSLTEYSFDVGGWGAELAHNYTRKADVVNRGFSGYNTKWALPMMEQLFVGCNHSNTLLVVVFFGANDACLPEPGGTAVSRHQHVPVNQYVANLRSMVTWLGVRGLTRVLLVTPPPVYEPGRAEYVRHKYGAAGDAAWQPDRTNEATGRYAAAAVSLGRELSVPVVELWRHMQDVRTDWGPALLSDGLHFTPAGNHEAFLEIYSVVARFIPEIRPEQLPLHFPSFLAFEDAAPTA